MRRLNRDLLEYSSLTYDALSAVESVNFEEVINEVVWNLQAKVAETGAEIRVDPLPVCVANRRGMLQLFQNLIGNAIKYAGQRKPELCVSADEQRSGAWVFHVRDNGIGIDMRYRNTIFEVFKRLHKRNEYGGTGIGLAICKRIVELHGGTIWVESEPGRGATFSFELPSIMQRGSKEEG